MCKFIVVREYCSAGANGDVALLIDFWNLVSGVANDVNCEALFSALEALRWRGRKVVGVWPLGGRL